MILKIVIPTYNRSTFIVKILKEVSSFIKKNDDCIELIVVDDHSLHVERENLRKLSYEYPWIRFVFLDKNTGGARVRNIGATYGAVCKWIWFFDDDDFITKESLAVVIDYLASNNFDEKMVFLPCLIKQNGLTVKEKVPASNSLYKKFSTCGHDVNTSCSIIDFDLYKKINGWDPSLIAGQDTDLFLRISQFTDAKVIGDVFVEVNQGHESITSNPKKQWVAKIQFLKKNYKLLSFRRNLRYLVAILTFYPFLRKIIK